MTPREAAEWMQQELAKRPTLYQSRVASYLSREGSDLVYRNKNGNKALVKAVLEAFRQMTPGDEFVWSRSNQLWHHRRPFDRPGRMQK